MSLHKQYTKGIHRIWLYFFTLMVGVTMQLSCAKFVEVDLPQTELTGATVFNDPSTAVAAIGNIYATMRNEGILSGVSGGLTSLMGHYADEMIFYNFISSVPQREFFQNSLIPTNTAVGTLWNSSYNRIFAANDIIQRLEKSEVLSESLKRQLKGEALFIRALIHFYLVNLFGDIPYIITTDYRITRSVSRLPVSEVFQKIIADLNEADSQLGDAYPVSGRIRPNKWVAKALLARVYLYAGNWVMAENVSTDVINQSALYTLEPEVANVFLKNSRGTIWHFHPNLAENNTLEAITFYFLTAPPPTEAIDNNLINSMESGDKRINWFKPVTNASGTWYHAYKYKVRGNTTTSVEYSVVLRLEEQHLIRAEARAQQNNISGAQQDLNIIRTRAGLPLTTAASKSDLLTAILNERRIELFLEHGHRWFDLKRTGKADQILSGVKTGWNATDTLLPLPERELLSNPNLFPQNPGY